MATATLPAHLRWRGQLVLIGVLLGLSLTAWLVTSARMRGMDDGPGTALASVGFFVTAWVVMMAAMMFPSIAPMVLTYRTIQRGRRRAGRSEPTAATSAFIAGYLVAWTAFGLAAYALFELVSSLSLDALAWDRGGRYLAGAVIVAAAVYQLTPAKDACLRRCRGPLTFLTEEWRDGLGGALRMGISHGFWCVGCCWALMASLFALGVMSMTWMLFIAALISAEKLAALARSRQPRHRRPAPRPRPRRRGRSRPRPGSGVTGFDDDGQRRDEGANDRRVTAAPNKRRATQ